MFSPFATAQTPDQTYPLPAEGQPDKNALYNATANQQMRLRFRAFENINTVGFKPDTTTCSGVDSDLVNTFPGATTTLVGAANVRDFIWTPTSRQAGNSYLLCAFDTSSSTRFSVTIRVVGASIAQPQEGVASGITLTLPMGATGGSVTSVEKWQRCTTAGMNCTDISGATGTTYSPTGSGYFLRAVNVGYSYTPSGATTAVTGTIAAVDSAMAVAANNRPSVGTAPATLTLTTGGENGIIRMHNISDSDGDDLSFSITTHPDSAIATATIDTATGVVTVTPVGVGETQIDITADDGRGGSNTQTLMIRVNAPPPAESSSSSGGVVALALIGAGAYFWWKKRQIQSGNAAKMALLPDVSFDLDRSDRRAFYTKMNWANSGDSNWQIRSNLALHTKYSGELLDWNADSHIGYRLNGKFGEFNPYMNAKFVASDPEAVMQTRYSLGLNYQMPNRFAIQIVQPNSDLANYSLGIQWQGKSKIRYSLQNETGRNSYRFTGQFSF